MVIALALSLSVTGCDDFLEVRNPGSLSEGELTEPALVSFMVNGVIAEFQFAYGTYAVWSGVLSDEAFTDHPNVNIRDIARHTFNDLNTHNEAVYDGLQRTRRAADDAAERLKTMLGASARSNQDVARTLIYGGYAHLLLGEGFCSAPVNAGGPLLPNELFTMAIARFDEGIAIATAAGLLSDASGARDLVALARVGAARAALGRGELARAREYADSVPPSYERWAWYSNNSLRENNAFLVGVRASMPFLGMHPAFQGANDIRAPQPSTTRTSLGGNPIYTPLKPSMFSGWSGTTPAPIDGASHIRFASGLEAQYIKQEADGPSASMLAFVNARRATAGKAAVNLGGAALIAEFRRQRAFDFYLTGRRLGDLRRYASQGTDLFPSGAVPLPNAGNYGSMHCFIVPLSEKSTNPAF